MLNRRAMREIVFNNPTELRKLEQILIPQIDKLLVEELDKIRQTQSFKWWFYEAAVLFKFDGWQKFHECWAIVCEEKTQLKRLIERDQITESLAKQMLESQVPRETMIAFADKVFYTDKSLPEVEQEILAELNRL